MERTAAEASGTVPTRLPRDTVSGSCRGGTTLTTRGTLLLICFSDERHPQVVVRADEVAHALHLKIFVYFPVLERSLAAVVPGTWAAAEDARESEFKRAYDELETTIDTLAAHGHEVDGRVEWRRSPASGALNLVRELSPRLVMLAPKRHDRLASLLLSDDDFELIRLCRCPVWLARRFPARGGTIVAAVDPTHEGDRAFAVDHAVLSESCYLAHSLGKRVSAVHAFSTPRRLGSVVEATAPAALDRQSERAGIYHFEQLLELAQLHALEAADLHVLEGDLVDVMQRIEQTLDVDVVVIGALSRNRARRMLIGGTAEELLRSLATDVVVVKQ